MTPNDEKIKEVLGLINKKKAEVGDRPKAVRRSNGLLKVGDEFININTLNTLDSCVYALAGVLKDRSHLVEAYKILEIEYPGNNLDDYIEDIKFKVSLIKWEVEKKKLDAMENNLKQLRSDAAKTADAVADIMDQLKL